VFLVGGFATYYLIKSLKPERNIASAELSRIIAAGEQARLNGSGHISMPLR